MSKDKIQLLSPLFLKYQTDYEKNPRSRVFAPLAETYRKLGMTDKAMEILAQGIRFHPTYVMGYLGLAFCYFDLRQYSLAYNTLRPLVEMSRDNIRLQKLFADICLELGYKEEALDTFKYLLFINPRDKEVGVQVANLERQLEDRYKPVHQPIFIPESEFKSDKGEREQPLFDIDKLENRPKSSQADFDDWMALDLSREQKPVETIDPYDQWNVKKGDSPANLAQKTEELISEKKQPEKIVERKAEVKAEIKKQEAYPELFLNYEDEEDNSSPAETPLVTHTLVDLYCGQGHIEKALEVLEKILILNPHDEKTIKKIEEIKSLMGSYAEDDHEDEEREPEIEYVEHQIQYGTSQSFSQLEDLKETSEEDGRKNLMDIFDQQVGHVEVGPVYELPELKPIVTSPIQAKNQEIKRRVEEKLTNFLKKIQKRALDYQARV